MNRKIFSIAVVALFFGITTSAEAQQSKKIPVVGVLWGSSPDGEKNLRTGFQRGLQELRYVEGKNILVEDRYADGKLDRSPSLAAELVQLKVDVIVVSFLPGALALKEATKTIPIVMVSSVDPVAAGLIDSLAHPGGNVTGVASLRRDLSGKRLELLKEIVPGRSHFGGLWDANAPGPVIAFKEYDAAARALKIQFQSIEVRGPDPDLDGAFQAVAKSHVDALIVVSNPVLRRYREQIASLATKNRLPTMYEQGEMVDAGGLISYAANEPDQFRRAAIYVDKILKGAKPSDLPVEQPMKFELMINLKTAKALNLTIPQSVLYRADKVIK